jgi:hypothetical protein
MLSDRSNRSKYVQAIPFPLRGYDAGLDYLDLYPSAGRSFCCSIIGHRGGVANSFGSVYRYHGGLLGYMWMEAGPKNPRGSPALTINVFCLAFFRKSETRPNQHNPVKNPYE